MSVTEFVVIDSTGEEVGLVDPVKKVWQTKCYWYVTNGGASLLTGKEFIYRFWKYDGWQYITRVKEDI